MLGSDRSLGCCLKMICADFLEAVNLKAGYDIIFYTGATGFIPGAIGLIDSGSSPSPQGL